MGQLVGNGGVTDDRPGNQLGKQGDIGAKIDDVPLGLDLSTVYINGVGHGLEGVKGDANGQRQAQQGNIRMEEQVDVLNQKIAIFKKPQKSQVDDNGGDDGSLCPGRMAMLFNIEAVGIIADCGKQHKQNIDRLSPGVKNQAEEEKRQVFTLLGHDKVGRQSQGQKKI